MFLINNIRNEHRLHFKRDTENVFRRVIRLKIVIFLPIIRDTSREKQTKYYNTAITRIFTAIIT